MAYRRRKWRAGPGPCSDPARGRRVRRTVLHGGALLFAALVTPPAAAQHIPSSSQGPWLNTLSYLQQQDWWDQSSRWGVNDVLGQERAFNMQGGKKIGRFDFAPTLDTKLVYDDNIYNRTSNAKGDFYTEIAPGLSVSTETARHYFNITAGLRGYKYAKYDEFDALDRSINASAAFQVDSAHVIYGTIGHALVNEDNLSYLFPDVEGDRQSNGRINAAQRTPVHNTIGEVGIRRDGGRLHGSLTARFGRRDFDDIELEDGSIADQDYRDVQTVSGTARVGYRFSPGYELVTLASATRVDFLDSASDYADGWEYEVAAGLDFQTGPLLQWQIGGGYAYRTFDDPTYEPTGDYIARLKLQWSATERLTLKAEAQRRLSFNTTETGVEYQLSHSVGASADLELYRNLIFTINGQYWDVVDERSSIKSNIYEAGVRLQYFSTQNWVASVGYDYVERVSDSPDLDLKRSQFWGRVKIRF